jgi:hypothetical protein
MKTETDKNETETDKKSKLKQIKREQAAKNEC